MWNQLGIRIQLVMLIGMVLAVMEIATLVTVHIFDQRERQAIALDQVNTLARSLNNDLLRAIVTPDADNYANLNFRISGYQTVVALTLFNHDGQPILRYGKERFACADQVDLKDTLRSHFLPSGHLCQHISIEAEGHRFGDSMIVINLDRLQTQRNDYLITVALIFPVALLIGLLPAWAISRSYTQPFNRLALAMQQADLSQHQYQKVETQATNEIGQLFRGYNQMLDKIMSSAEEIYYQSRHDFLTGLYNRLAAEEFLKRALKDEQAQTHVLLRLDLDDFKLVNDSLGHLAGDRLLQLIAQRCQTELPDNGIMARISGDDFFILLSHCSETNGIKVAEHYQALLKEFPFQWEEKLQATSASIGMITFAPYEFTLDELLKTVDLALEAAKSAGRNQLHRFNPDNDQTKRLEAEVQVAALLKEALHDGPARFVLYTQKIAPLSKADGVINYEVLIRMLNGKGELLTPDRFLPTAERYQMMADIDAWVLYHYLETASANPKHIKQLGFAHINLAGGTLNNPNFQKQLKKAIARFDFPWNKLELEITETTAVGNFGQARRFIEYCRNKGIGFALDDFGTGMASFDYLKNLPFDVVKIDGSFVRNLHNDPADQAMISYTHEICKMRNQKTIAEYVETQQDVDKLADIGIDYGQGYFLGRPLPLDELLECKSRDSKEI